MSEIDTSFIFANNNQNQIESPSEEYQEKKDIHPSLVKKCVLMCKTKEEMQKEKEQKELEDARRIYKENASNIIKSSEYRKELCKGAKEGESPELLFIKACECITVITGDLGFLNTIKEYIKTENI